MIRRIAPCLPLALLAACADPPPRDEEPGLIVCDRKKVDPRGDPLHCGECDHVCPGDQVCSSGTCACPLTTTACTVAGALRCVDTRSDPSHCGACGQSCADDQVCSVGACLSVCPSGRTTCGQSCVDLARDAGHCGACGHGCGPEQTCRDGACVTPVLWVSCYNGDRVRQVGVLNGEWVPGAASIPFPPDSNPQILHRTTDGALVVANGAADTVSLIRGQEIRHHVAEAGDVPSDVLADHARLLVVSSFTHELIALPRPPAGEELPHALAALRVWGLTAEGDAPNPYNAALLPGRPDRAYVTLLMADAVATVDLLREGTPAVSRIPLPTGEDLVHEGEPGQARPQGIVAQAEHLYVTLTNARADWSLAGPGHLVALDPEGGTPVLWTLPLQQGDVACRNAQSATMLGDRVLVSCSGVLGEDAGRVAVVSVAGREPVIERIVATHGFPGTILPVPEIDLAFVVDWGSGGRILALDLASWQLREWAPGVLAKEVCPVPEGEFWEIVGDIELDTLAQR